MKASIKKTQINHKKSNIVKGNVTYVSSFKKRNKVKPYVKFDLDWQNIIRANDPEKRLHEGSVILASRIGYELHKNHDRKVYLSTHWMQDVTKKKADQTARRRQQIEHIFNMTWHRKVLDNGVWLSNVFEVYYQEGYEEILGLQDVVKTACTNAAIMPVPTSFYAGTMPHKSGDYMYDKEKEEEPLGYSSSFSNNEKLKIKSFSEPEETPQEEITEIPTLATGYPTEPAKVYQTEEIHVEASEVVTNCHEFEAQPYGKSVQLESQALTEEKELYQSHRNLRPSSGLNLLQDIPLLANLLSPTVDDSSIVAPETIEPDKNVQFPKYQEVTPMKQQQIPNEPKRNMEFELSGAIFKSFGGVKSDEIMENCKFIAINENKLGVQLSNGFSLTPTDRDRLKACIRLVYGEGINIVSSAVLKIAQPKAEILVKPQIQQYYRKWTKFRNDLLNYLPEKTGHHSLNAWFDKLRVSEDMAGNRIILTGSRFYVDSVYNRFQSAIEYVVTKNKVTLELHFENNDEKPIIYKPNGGF
jgi:hypothetical protein